MSKQYIIVDNNNYAGKFYSTLSVYIGCDKIGI